ncbi:MAG: hypothetical protein ACPIG6_11115, partial [Akkermansiaceae bacterium]
MKFLLSLAHSRAVIFTVCLAVLPIAAFTPHAQAGKVLSGPNTATGTRSVVAGGVRNSASGNTSIVGAGRD